MIKEVTRVFLCAEELQIILDKEFTIERLSQVKDIFIFSCLTGLSYSDIKKITFKNIIIGTDGKKWLFVNRTKTALLLIFHYYLQL